jgi:uncharacterized membrane protein
VYLAFKLLHVAAVVIFMGNIISGMFWKRRADRTRDPRLIAHALEGIIASDRLFTVPGVIAIVVFGFGASGMGDLPLLRTPWILWSLILFIVSALAFMIQLVPLQRKMAAMARKAAGGGEMDWAAYEALSRRWDLWGAVSLLTPALVTVLMVLKPVLPAF